ncbi:hypothetical protein EW145_g5606 [Phellinidium pouzarii]|uniref:lytic cellulose monooxygenase (C4-dehydrogenating) n=1 Tax=Phellinidium pouzarii TaxID=167371 RepID=A0A4S4KZF4_9AGAM|nr:hypothetical protein EW145_g5606 [Phellinidium pouzarii]
MKSTIFGISLLSVLPLVAAHGFLRQITIDGKTFAGDIPQGTENPSVIRLIDKVDPVKGATNRAVNCGQDAKIAALVADANPSSNVTFDWAGGDGGNWPHNIGPLMTYLSTCGNTTCDKFDAINAKWFKINEAGQRADGTWVQQDLMNGGTFSITLPSNLAPGQYLVRNEIIALHLATEQGGAEFYPSCSQINVGGNQTGVPAESDLVSLPGAYADNDPGIFDPTVFNPGATYVFPGPEVATLVDSDCNSTPSAAADSTSASATPSSIDSSFASSSTSTSQQNICGNSFTSFSLTSASASASESAAIPITAFTITSTINLTFPSPALAGPVSSSADATLTAALLSATASPDAVLAVRPRRVSRIMRDVFD